VCTKGNKLLFLTKYRICKEPQTANPLYLRCLLEEMRVFGVFEEVDQLLEHYLRARQAPQLLEKILHRFEKVPPPPFFVFFVFCFVYLFFT
jgi:hypothetical protein